jgi:hypothetical protein
VVPRGAERQQRECVLDGAEKNAWDAEQHAKENPQDCAVRTVVVIGLNFPAQLVQTDSYFFLNMNINSGIQKPI